LTRIVSMDILLATEDEEDLLGEVLLGALGTSKLQQHHLIAAIEAADTVILNNRIVKCVDARQINKYVDPPKIRRNQEKRHARF